MKKIFLGLLFSTVFFLGTAVYPAQSEDLKVATGREVAFDYTLTVDGQVVDSSQGRGPVHYTHGQGGIIPALAAKLQGMKVGDKVTVTIPAKDGYGEVDPKAFQEVPKTNLPKDQAPQVGMMLEMNGPNGRPILATISEVKSDTVVLNFNHPMAGKDLNFDVTIISVK